MKNLPRIQLLLAFAIGIGCSVYCYSLYNQFPNRWNYLTWDAAAHGWDGMRLAMDVSNLRPLKLLLDINGLVLWPPLHAIFETPFFLLFGMDFHAAVLCSLTFLALFFPAITWVYQQLAGQGRQDAGGTTQAGWILLMALIWTSPYFLGFSTMPMIEIAGATLTCLSASLFLRNSRWFPLSLTLLFFVKYNYCLYVLLPVVAIEFSKQNFRTVWHFVRKRKLALAVIILFAIFAAIILITGGVRIGSVSIRGLGNPAYITFLILIAILFVTKQHREIWNATKGAGWEWFVIPVLIWLLIPSPNRMKTLISFSINRSLGGPAPTTVDYYSYYLKTLPLYFENFWITWLCVVSAAIVVFFFRKDRKIQFLCWLFLIPFLLMTLNQNKQDRFLFTFIPVLWILSAFAIDKIPWRIVRYTLPIGFCFLVALELPTETVRDHVRRQFAPLRVQSMLNFIVRRVGDAQEVRVLGATNDLNPSSIQYQVAADSGFTKSPHFGWEIEKDPPRNTQVICIDGEIHAKLVKSKDFPDGTTIRHYILDTPEAAPYNPNQ